MDSRDELRLLELALDGDRGALDSLLEHHLLFLVILASRKLDPLVSARLSGSDVTQQTCLEAMTPYSKINRPRRLNWCCTVCLHVQLSP